MTSLSLTDGGVRAVKRALVLRFPNYKSSHVSEALAAACGHRTNASLIAAIRSGDTSDPDYVLLDESAFFDRLEELHGGDIAEADRRILFDWLQIERGEDVLKTTSAKYHKIDYSKSKRRRAWRNALVAGINEGLSRRFFSLKPGDNRWPSARKDPLDRQEAQIFRFDIGGIPAIASLWDAGYDELSVHVGFWPTYEADRWIAAANAGFLAAELFASGWLERRNGAWLQVSSSGRSGWSFRCRKHRLDDAAALSIRPAGYADRGSFVM